MVSKWISNLQQFPDNKSWKLVFNSKLIEVMNHRLIIRYLNYETYKRENKDSNFE